MKNNDFKVIKTSIEDLDSINKIYKEVTGMSRSNKEAIWEWVHNGRIRNSWIILFKNKIVGHHGFITIPLAYKKKKHFCLRTENSMMLDKYKDKIPYFLVERKILFKLKKKYSLILTTAGKNAPIEMRKKLGYENIAFWKICLYNNHLKYKIKNVFSMLTSKSLEARSSVLEKNKTCRLKFLLNPNVGLLCKEAINNLQYDRISFYPDKNYILWRFIKNPYHKYFSAIINMKNNNKVVIIWYEVKRSRYLTDIIIEYLSFPKKFKLNYIFYNLNYIFNNGQKKCRFIYRIVKKNSDTTLTNGRSSLLICFNKKQFKKDNLTLDSAIRQGVHS